MILKAAMVIFEHISSGNFISKEYLVVQFISEINSEQKHLGEKTAATTNLNENVNNFC